MKFGVCYYPEHWPQERWAVDARMMRSVGLSIVRVGEFAWAKMEPAEGNFTWDWLDQAIASLANEKLQVVLGTPTATPPAWLCRAYPEILPVDAEGRRRNFGSRRHCCPNSPAYRRHTERIVTVMAERYAGHPAVIGWQIDNEFGCHDTARCYCDVCAAAFRNWIKAKYKTLEALNDAWGTVFWSQTYTHWNEIDPPILTVTAPNPSHVLDYYRFSSDSWLEYQQIQIDLLRSAIAQNQPADNRQAQFITTNFMGNFPDLDYHALARPLDFVTWDSYPTGYAEVAAQSLYQPKESRPALAYDAGDPYVTGFCHDLTRGLKQAPFWVMEQQCGNINWSIYNTGVRPGTVRLWTWHALASGADAVVYFRWRASLYAQEQFHSGLLNHDGSPNLGYREVAGMHAERELMAQISTHPVKAQVALLLDYHDLWALQLQPHRRDFGYLRHLFVFYRALKHLGVTVDIISPEADLTAYQIVLAPTVFLGDEQLANRLARFASGGGTVLLGVRSGFKTHSNLVTDQPLPGVFGQITGITLSGWQALPPDIGFEIETDIPNLNGPAAFWAEGLLPAHSAEREAETGGNDLKTLALYTSGPFASQAALTENPVGDGRAYYLGWYPNIEQAGAILAHLLDQAGIPKLADLPSGLIATSRGPYTVLLNFSEEQLTATIKGQPVRVGPRDIRVLE